MTERDHPLLAMEFPAVLALEHGVVEHPRGAHEIDAVIGEILAAEFVVPLEHQDLYAPTLLDL